MTKDQWITAYCQRQTMSRELFDRYYIAVPCDGSEIGCQDFTVERKWHDDQRPGMKRAIDMPAINGKL